MSQCVCHGTSCISGQRCAGPRCFTSLTVANGTAFLQKGCVAASEEGSLYCNSGPSAQLLVECCEGDLCNMNVSLRLPVRGEKDEAKHQVPHQPRPRRCLRLCTH